MKTHQNDDKEVYGWCDLFDTDEWHIFSKDPLDDNKRARFLDKMTYRSSLTNNALLYVNAPEFDSAVVNSYPPYGISYNSILSAIFGCSNSTIFVGLHTVCTHMTVKTIIQTTLLRKITILILKIFYS